MRGYTAEQTKEVMIDETSVGVEEKGTMRTHGKPAVPFVKEGWE
jgi:hypothetical protein